MKHRRGRSLSEALTLEQSDEGAVVVSNIENALTNQTLKKGDEIWGATIKFDQLSKEEVLKVLKLMAPYDDKIQVLTRNNRTRSLQNLDEVAKTPETMLQDSYSKLFNAKIKKYMRSDSPGGGEGYVNGNASLKATMAGTTKASIKQGLPRLGVDFGRLGSQTPSSDALDGLQADVGELNTGSNLNLPPLGVGSTLRKAQVPRVSLDAHSPQLNLPDFHPSGTLPHGSGSFEAPEMGVDLPHSEFRTPEIDSTFEGGNIMDPSLNVDVPKLSIEGPNQGNKWPKFKVPDLDLSGSSLSGPEVYAKTPDLHSGKVNPISLNSPDLDVDNLSGYVDSHNLRLSAKSPDMDLQMPDIKGGMSTPNVNLPKADLKGPKLNTKMPSVDKKYKAPKFQMPKFDLPDIEVPELLSGGLDMHTSKPEFDFAGPKLKGLDGQLKTPDINPSSLNFGSPDLDLPEMEFHKPDLNLSGPDLHVPSVKLKGSTFKKPKVDLNAPALHVDAPTGKVKMPKANLSGTLPKGPNLNLNTDLKTPDLNFKSPKIKGGIDAPDFDIPDMNLKVPKLKAPNFSLKGPKTDLNMGDYDFEGPSGNFQRPDLNLPNLGFSGPKLEGPSLDLKSPDVDLNGHNVSGGINTPGISIPKADLSLPKLDLNSPKLNLEKPSGKLKIPEIPSPDWDLKAPSGKLKMPKLNLSGPKGPNMDLNADLKSPDWRLKAPNLKGGIDAPNHDLPDINLKTPKLDMNTPDVNIGSPKTKLKFPKLKMPKFGRSTLKGPEIDGSLNGPDLGLNAHNVNLKGPKADLDVDIDGPSGKFKKPNFKFPDFGLSGPKLDGPNLDVKTPDLNLPDPNLSGGLTTPDFNTPKINLKSPKLDLSAPKLNLDMPSGKMNTPELASPEWDINAPSAKLKKPKFNLFGTLPKGPKLDLDGDWKSPDLSLKAPELEGGINAPRLDLPNMNLKTPKLDVNAPNINIGSPKTKVKFPKLKMPKFGRPSMKGPEFDGDIKGPNVDLSAPNINLHGPKADLDVDAGLSGKFKKPNINIPGFGLSGPKVDGPNLDLKSPDMDLSGLNLSGGIKTPDLNMPKVNAKAPKMDLTLPKLSMPSGKLKTPDLNPDWDAPSGKLKMPSLDLSGTVPKGPKLDLNADMKSPNWNLKSPKLKGGIDAPDLDLPKLDLKTPKLNMNAPDVNIGSPKAKMKMPKMKMPKVNLPNLDGNIDRPDFDINAPNIDLKGSRPGLDIPDVDLKTPSGKFKMPQIKIPDVGFSSPELDGPDIDFDEPTLRAKLPKGPNLKLNPDLKAPDLNLKAPQIKGGFDTPKLGFPNMDLSAPKLDMNSPDFNIGLPDSKIKKPKVNLPKGSNFDIDGSFKRPDVNMPNVEFTGPKGKFKMPSLNTPDLDLSGPNAKMPDLNLSGSKLSGPGMVMPNLPDANLKAPKLDLNASRPDLGMNGIGKPDLNFSDLPNLGLSTPNAKMNVKPVELTGNVKGPHLSAPNMDVSIPKSAMQLRNTDLNVDNPSSIFRSSFNDLRVDELGANMRVPDFDVDEDIKLHHPDRKIPIPKPRLRDSERSGTFSHHIDFHRQDLNIDDFTGKEHVLRARGSTLDLKAPRQSVGQSGVNIDMKEPRIARRNPAGGTVLLPNVTQDSNIRVPDGSDEYLITAFSKAQSQVVPNRKYNTLGGLDFDPGNLDLEVPNENDLKGSSIFYNLV